MAKCVVNNPPNDITVFNKQTKEAFGWKIDNKQVYKSSLIEGCLCVSFDFEFYFQSHVVVICRQPRLTSVIYIPKGIFMGFGYQTTSLADKGALCSNIAPHHEQSDSLKLHDVSFFLLLLEISFTGWSNLPLLCPGK